MTNLTNLTWRKVALRPDGAQPKSAWGRMVMATGIPVPALPVAARKLAIKPVTGFEPAAKIAEDAAAPSDISPKDYALHLLRVAAEVEHAFVVQYLYSWFSIHGNGEIPNDWETNLKEVAIEEMGHLLCVQNILLYLGADPYFELETEPIDQKLVPFTFSLERFSVQSVGKYLVAESPLDAQLPPELKDTKTPPGSDAPGVHHVGVIYALLYWLFLSDDQSTAGPWQDFPQELRQMFVQEEIGHLQDSDFAPASAIGDRVALSSVEFPQGSTNILILPETFPTANPSAFQARDEALKAIYAIDRQGEGGSSAPESHYSTFTAIYTALKTAGFDGALKVVANPTLVAAAGKTLLTNAVARAWAALFNLRYRSLILQLAHTIALARSLRPGYSDARKKMAKYSVRQEMAFITLAGMTVMSLPASDATTPLAGPPFELLQPILPDDEKVRWTTHLSLLDSIAQAVAAIKQVDPGWSTRALNIDDHGPMAQIDQQHRTLVTAQLAQIP